MDSAPIPPGCSPFRGCNPRAVIDATVAAVLLMAAVGLGVFTTGYKAERAMTAQLGHWLSASAVSLAGIVHPDSLALLDSPEKEDGPVYRDLYARIHDFKRRHPAFHFAYTCVLRGDSVYFAVDGTPPGDADSDGVQDHSGLLEPYPEASPSLLRTLREGGVHFDDDPYTDAWGTFQSGSAAITDRNGAVVGAAIVDMDVGEFRDRIQGVRRAEIFGIVLALLIALGAWALVYSMRSREIQNHAWLLMVGQELEHKNSSLEDSRAKLVESQRQAGLGHWTYHPDTGEMEWSEEMYRVHGLEPDTPAQTLPELLASAHPEDRVHLAGLVAEVLEEGKNVEWTYRKLLPDGRLRHLFFRARPFRDKAGKVIQVKGISQDVTRWHEVEAALVEAKEEAERATKAKSEFLAMMSHEIRTPMNGVLGMAHLLRESGLRREQGPLVDTLLESGEHLLDLINDILDFSKIEAGSMELESIPFDLRKLGASVCGVLRGKADGAGLDLQFRFLLPPESVVRGDPGRVRQILYNLVGNAIKFTNRGYVRVTIEEDAAGGEAIRFAVEDTGIGMSRGQCGQLFRPFKQADSSTSRKFGGTGLGLAITRRLVEMMRGTVSVESEPGRGSIFTVRLPLARAESPGEGACGGTDGPVLPCLEGFRVLLIDDRPTSRLVLRRQMEGLGMRVWEAASGREARVLLDALEARGELPQAVLADWRMPEEDGLETGRRLRAEPRTSGLPILLLTFSASRGDAQAVREAGMDGLLVKPIPSEVLAGAIHLAAGGFRTGERTFITRHVVQDLGLRLARPAAAKPTAAPPADWTASPPEILLAEDNPVNQKVGIQMLRKIGCRVTVAADGEQALRLLAEREFDLVLMDCMMPALDGYEATRTIRSREEAGGKRLPVIACTANATQDEVVKCMAAGMDDFLSKPYRPEKLRELVERWVDADRPSRRNGDQLR